MRYEIITWDRERQISYSYTIEAESLSVAIAEVEDSMLDTEIIAKVKRLPVLDAA